MELGVLGPLHVRQAGAPVTIPGAKPRALLTMLGLHDGSVVPAETLLELLWGIDPPRTADKALQTHVSTLRRTLGDGLVLTEGAGWRLAATEVDASLYRAAARRGRDAAAAGDISQAVARFDEALALWRGVPELPETRRGSAERTRWVEGHAALVEDRAEALLATGRAAEIIGELETAVADAPLRERRWGQLMLALYRAGRQGEAIGAFRRARTLLAEELGVEPGPELRRLETAIIAQDAALDAPAAQSISSIMRAVTFLLTDIEGSTAAWETDAVAMATALARHDELAEQIVTSRGGRLIKTRGEGDATFSVFDRPSAAAAAALELQDAIAREPWSLADPMRIRVALHTGEVELRDGDYFGRAVNRAARLRSLAAGGQILCSGATAELVIDSLPDDVVLSDLGVRQLRNLARPEHVFELRLASADERPAPESAAAPLQRPGMPAMLTGPGPFVGRGTEVQRLFTAWQTALAGSTNAVLIAGEPGVGKTRLAGEWSRQAYDDGAIVIYGRCDEDLGAPYQPFAEALRALVPALGAAGLRGLRGVEALLPLVPGLCDVLPDLTAPPRADPDTERYALFDAVVAMLRVAATGAPVVLILDDLHWAAKPTLLLMRHLLRFGDQARVQIIGTYRSTDLDRSHPLAAMLADLHRDGTASRLNLGGLDEDDVTCYVAESGYDDEDLARALASVTGGNPFFLIEALRHVDESGGHWDANTLPQGVREAVSRRLSRLPEETNKALAAAAVVGSRFAVELVERVLDQDLVDAFEEAAQAGIVIEEPGGHYRFNHAIVRQSLLAELASVRRMRLHQHIAATLESRPGAGDELLAELAYHYFECAWAGNAVKAVEYCRRAADQAMARLGYEGAAELYGRALHALEEIDEDLPDRPDQTAELLLARCEALLAAGDVTSAAGTVTQLHSSTVDSERWAAWATCFDGQLAMLTHPERLDEIEIALGAAADKLAGLDDAGGEAKAHTVRASCLARLGRIGDCEAALDDALTAARRARDHRRVNAVLAGAPLAALWGPNPVPRAGGRCLDVVRLLRITTDSPAVEATSMRCQAVLEAFRGRAPAARRMIESARRTVTELGLRHAISEVEQFAGIVELIVAEPAASETHLRLSYNGFRRMGLDADTAETAALLGRACLALGRDAEADELCSESERLAGHALKPSIAWRTLRAQLLSRGDDHEEARQVAEAAVSLAARTDLLVDHGDACLTLASVLDASGDAVGARTAAGQAAALYERKGADALVQIARELGGVRISPSPSATSEASTVAPVNKCVRTGGLLIEAVNRQAWGEVERLLASHVSVESRRKIVGFPRIDVPSSRWPQDMGHFLQAGMVRYRHAPVAVRGERCAITRLELATADLSPGAPRDEMLHLAVINEEGLITLQIWFDVEDIEAAIAELDTLYTRLGEHQPRRPENAASRLYERYKVLYAARDWGAVAELLADNIRTEDRRRVVNSGLRHGPHEVMAEILALADVGIDLAFDVIATRGERLFLSRLRTTGPSEKANGFHSVVLNILELDVDGKVVTRTTFDLDDFDAAMAELDARYLAGEGAAHARTWSVITQGVAALNRHELPSTTTDFVSIDHRRVAAYPPGEVVDYVRAGWDLDQNIRTYVEVVRRLSDIGAVYTHVARGVSRDGFDAEWRGVSLVTLDRDLVKRTEVFDEEDLDAALARFDQLSGPARPLENAASHAYHQVNLHYSAGDWTALSNVLAPNMIDDDRRHAVNAGIRLGRDAQITNSRAVAETGTGQLTSTVVASRGEHLALCRTCLSGQDQQPEPFRIEFLSVVEINADRQVMTHVAFDDADFLSAVEELDERYVVGEAVAHANTWSLVTGSYSALNRHELPSISPDCLNIDHRGESSFGFSDLIAHVGSGRDSLQEIKAYVEAAHRLNDLGAVITYAAEETAQGGFRAEWRGIALLTFDGDMLDRCEVFDEADLDAALARLDELSRPVLRPDNIASRAFDRVNACFAVRDWAAIAEMLSEDVIDDDRRRMANAGVRSGRDAVIQGVCTAADLGTKQISSTAIATRGDHLALCRARYSGDDRVPDAFYSEALSVIEIDADERVTYHAGFGIDDFHSAIEELDERYLAVEAAPHARTWSVIAAGFGAINRRELPPTTPNWANVDHRQGAAFASGEMTAYIRAAWDLEDEVKVYVEAVHRLSDVGAVLTFVTRGTSQDGFDAEWRTVELVTVEGDMSSRCELFDESDLGNALARFDELQRPPLTLGNSASRVAQRFSACHAARDWDGTAKTLADDFRGDDRRKVVGSGIQLSREAQIAAMRATADLWVASQTSAVVATRGEHLALMRARFSDPMRTPEAFITELLGVVEINAAEQIVAIISFDCDDFDSAIEVLDARFRNGGGAPHAAIWSLVTGSYAALNRHELPLTTSDCLNVDHRGQSAFGFSDLIAYLRAGGDFPQDIITYVEAVHQLNELGAVVTYAANETSREGFDAEWRAIALVTFAGALLNRCEIFGEGELDAALAIFEQLSRPQLENTASQLARRYLAHIADGNCDGMETILSDDICTDDRRRVVGAGVRKGKPALMTDLRTIAGLSDMDLTCTTIATRGNRLALMRASYQMRQSEHLTYRSEVLGVGEIDHKQRIVAAVSFDCDDFDSAIEELDARFLNGEAAPHGQAWAVVAASYRALNQRRLPRTTPDWISIDHRRLVPLPNGELTAYLRATWEQSPRSGVHIEAVHRLTDFGAVVTRVVRGTSTEGFDAEWRGIDVISVEGGLINRCELFDEVDFDCAIKRFDELRPPRLQNAASRVAQRFADSFTAHDWDAVAQVFAEDYYNDDRRRVVNAGVRPGRSAAIEDLRVSAELGLLTSVSWESVAVRGESLVLTRFLGSGGDPEKVRVDVLQVVEVANSQIVSAVVFDFDDIDAAFAELDARYLAGEAVENSATWSVVMSVYSALNRHELPATTPDWINIDHRPLVAIEDGDLGRWIRAAWDLAPEAVIRVEAVHRLSAAGAVVTHVAYATSREGLEAEWREIGVYTFDGHRISRCEVFSGADTDAAVARFDELQSQPPPLQNAATQALQCLQAHFAARNWVALADELAEDIYTDDRRRVIGAGIRHGRAAEIQGLQAAASVGTKQVTSTFLATRGERLVLARSRLAPNDQRPAAFYAEMIGVVEVNADHLVTGVVSFDVDDIDAAFAELDARYLAGEAGPCAHTWSVISRECAAFNRHELPATEFVTVDHRRLLKMATGNLIGDIEVTWDLMPDVSIRIESVHRLTHLGAVASYVAQGTSPEGFHAEWRITYLVTVDGDHISRCEIFDEADLDAALARFDELTVQGKDSAPGTE
ncbi:BTAD domain-containing putative transcriptional regulator [Mycobacterium paragordonae]|uniref:BTAD domain-containing putative transcriptional regulator n=1 Tax=Mycobacterium paragordonae TaxID=1389713 RepID=A0AAJ1SBF8_9MYCO|nr:BTAD domain-containing putative transcriptional regulator [Mycobacterium paragordonae]MDP7738507.1 BTAD domain-containing putative transcriptional regulator [Mycobacterium paragordonae]